MLKPLELGIMGFVPTTRSATIFDSGDQLYEATNVLQVARAVAATLTHADITANQYVYINSFTLTQNRVLAALEEVSGEKWTVNHPSVKEFGETSLARAKESEKSGKMSALGAYPDGVPELITAAIYGFRPEGVVSLNDFEGKARVWMDRLGLREGSLEGTIKEVLARVNGRS